jgi:hypothetical protein
MPTVKGIAAHHELQPAGRNPYYQPPPPSKRIPSPPLTRKVSAPTIIDADTVILDPQASDWVMVEPARAPQPTDSMQNRDGQGAPNGPSPFFWRRALTAYSHQMPAYTPFLSTGVQVNLVA